MPYQFINQLTLWDLVSSALAVISWILAIWALIYARKSADYSRMSLEQIITSRQLEQLKDINLIIHVQVAINSWKEEILEIAKHIEIWDISWLEKEAILTRREWSRRLMEKYLYERMPIWLSSIYESGAQYYYDGKCILLIPANDLIDYWSNSNELFDIYGIVDSLDELLWYIKNEIPEVFLNTPASIGINEFF